MTDDPSTTPLIELESLDKYDAVVVYGDFADADLDVVRAGVPEMIDARLQDDPGQLKRRNEIADRGDRELSAIYTGVGPDCLPSTASTSQ